MARKLGASGASPYNSPSTPRDSEAPGEPSVTFLPPRGSQEAVRAPKSFEEFTYGGPLDSVYRQTLSAFNQKLLTLAGAGVRLLIEGVCNDRGIKDGIVTD